MKLIGNLDIRKHDDTRWYLLHNFKCVTDDGRTVEGRRGFTYDGGSVPQSLWNIVPPMGAATDWGFFFHDCLYAWNRDNSAFVSVSEPFNRKEADQLMLEVHLHCGVSQELAEAIYTGVRLGASASWVPPAERKARRLAAAERRKTDNSILDQ